MKHLKKIVLVGFALLVVLVLGLVLGRNAIARASLESAGRDPTGFPISVASVNIPISFNAVDVRGIELKNPDGFEDKQFIDMPQISASGGFATLFGTPHIADMTLVLRTLLISRNAKG